MLLKIRKRWLVGLCLGAMLGVAARPVWDILVSVFEDPLWDHGTAAFSFIGERPDEIRIVALRLGDKVDDRL
jgi:hypothetical protein